MRIIARTNVGGPAIQVSGLTRHTDPTRFDHRLYTGWCAEDEADYLLTQAPDVPVTRVDGLGRAVKPGADVRVIHTLRNEIRRFRPHIIHTHTAKAGAIGRTASLLSGVPSARVHTFHGHLLHGYFSPRKTQAVIQLERQLARSCDRIVAVGAQVREDLLAVGIGQPSQYVIIPPGLEFPDPPSRAEARRSLGLSPDAVVVSLVGRLTGIKRADRFADAAGAIVRERPTADVQFIVAGEGDTAADLRTVIEQRQLPITMLGWRDDVEVVLAASDIVVLSSDNEGTPISLIQAATYGVPVVATDVGSVKDVVADGVSGLLCPPDAESLANGILRLIDEPGLRVTMGADARSLAQGRYSVDRLVGDHQDLYDAIVSEHRIRA